MAIFSATVLPFCLLMDFLSSVFLAFLSFFGLGQKCVVVSHSHYLTQSGKQTVTRSRVRVKVVRLTSIRSEVVTTCCGTCLTGDDLTVRLTVVCCFVRCNRFLFSPKYGISAVTSSCVCLKLEDKPFSF